MPHLIEPAATGRSKCRGCGERIEARSLRFGESVPNPFAEGDTFHWFHLDCGAYKRPEPFLEALEARAEPLEERERLEAAAREGISHPRLPRVNGAERSASGRAACRSCREPIAKGEWRIAVVFWEEGRFSPSGFIHPKCAGAYFETTDVLPRVVRFSKDLAEADVAEVRAQVEGAAS